jgi:hypothetical protein
MDYSSRSKISKRAESLRPLRAVPSRIKRAGLPLHCRRVKVSNHALSRTTPTYNRLGVAARLRHSRVCRQSQRQRGQNQHCLEYRPNCMTRARA